jgi:hypothetical protein
MPQTVPEIIVFTKRLVWRVLKERLDEPAVRLKSQYSSRLYLWAKQ